MSRLCGVAPALLAGWALLMLSLWRSTYAQETPAPDAATAPAQFFLSPDAATAVKLHTHAADFRLAYDGGALIASLDALYRLQNDGNDTASLTLRMSADPAGAAGAPPQNLVLMAGGQPVAFEPATDGALAARVTVGASATLDLHLSYAFALEEKPLTTLRYTVAPLRAWPGQPSLRVSIAVPPALAAESWLQTSPEGWRFSSDEGQTPRIRWLYDDLPAGEPFLFQFIHPATWQSLAEAQRAATPGAPVSTYLTLAETYRQLYGAATAPDMRERFYAQALAAYTRAIENATATGAPASEQASVQAGLAALYRVRAVNSDGGVNRTYTDLMIQAANLALAGLPAEDVRRQEILQWQVEGLTLQLDEARNRRDWPLAFALLDRLAALPPGGVDPDTLAETRRSLTVQQALDLLEQGDAAAASRLAGDKITSSEVLPPDNARPLFITWQITLTIEAAGTDLVAHITPAADRQAEARTALDELAALWASADPDGVYRVSVQELATSGQNPALFRLALSMPAGATGASLGRATPMGADWILLRTLLMQLGPQVEQQMRWLQQQVTLSQPLDLHSAGEQWQALAATLEQQAAGFEAQAPHLNLVAAEPTSAEHVLQIRIKSANYRKAAMEWRTLARHSLVTAQLAAGAGVQTVTRTWLATPETPLQLLELQAQVMSLSRLLITAVCSFAGLFLLAGVLWWLL
jgi:hypothetical protein